MPPLWKRIACVPIGTLSQRTHKVFWWTTLTLFWAALALPGGLFVPLAASLIGCASAAIDAFAMTRDALAGRAYPIMNPLRSLVSHRRAWAMAGVALCLLLSGIGLRISFFLAQPIVNPIAWRIWAVEPAPVRQSRLDAGTVRMVGPYLCKVKNSPNGLVLQIIGGGAIGLSEDASGRPVWGVAFYDLERFRASFGY
jgi:hypothetical protein